MAKAKCAVGAGKDRASQAPSVHFVPLLGGPGPKGTASFGGRDRRSSFRKVELGAGYRVLHLWIINYLITIVIPV